MLYNYLNAYFIQKIFFEAKKNIFDIRFVVFIIIINNLKYKIIIKKISNYYFYNK